MNKTEQKTEEKQVVAESLEDVTMRVLMEAQAADDAKYFINSHMERPMQQQMNNQDRTLVDRQREISKMEPSSDPTGSAGPFVMACNEFAGMAIQFIAGRKDLDPVKAQNVASEIFNTVNKTSQTIYQAAYAGKLTPDMINDVYNMIQFVYSRAGRDDRLQHLALNIQADAKQMLPK